MEAVEVTKMELGESDSSGRKKPISIKNSEHKLEADMVIKALGFDPENILSFLVQKIYRFQMGNN